MAIKQFNRSESRTKRHRRIRRNLVGSADKPRLSVYRSLTNIYAQLIDDRERVTLASASSMRMEVKAADGESRKIAQARLVGEAIAEAAKAKGISKVVFDRGGFLYHGRVKALAVAARAAGLEF
jgi:large subunit ribosomal protein L18